MGQPQKINFQSSVVDSLGKVLKNRPMQIKFEILDSSSQGMVVYEETHSCTTDASGMLQLWIGNGLAAGHSFQQIPWANGRSKFIRTSYSLTSGTFFTLSTQEFASVPYAMLAGSLVEGTKLMGSLGDEFELMIDSSGPVWKKVVKGKTCSTQLSFSGMIYPIVKIGNQCWMGKNLNVGSLKNSVATVDSQRNNGTLEKYCWNNQLLACDTFGGFYQWAEAINYVGGAVNNALWPQKPAGNIQGICPVGWHIPSYAEFDTLIQLFGGSLVAGGSLKGNDFWNTPNTGATNSSGFNAIGTGYRSATGPFNERGATAYFWTSTEYSSGSAQMIMLTSGSGSASTNGYAKLRGLSVRCLED